MKPLLVLLISFGAAVLSNLLVSKAWKWQMAGRIAMSVMLVFTAVCHFLFTDGMAMMIPDPIPFKVGLVYITAIFEVLGAIVLQVKKYQRLTAWLLVIFFMLVLPANIYGAIQQVDYEAATNEGKGVEYLWFRIPLQVLFILWVYFCVIKDR